MGSKISKSKLANRIKELQLRQLDHLRKEMKCISTIGISHNYWRRRLREQNNINYKNKYEILVGELSQN